MADLNFAAQPSRGLRVVGLRVFASFKRLSVHKPRLISLRFARMLPGAQLTFMLINVLGTRRN